MVLTVLAHPSAPNTTDPHRGNNVVPLRSPCGMFLLVVLPSRGRHISKWMVSIELWQRPRNGRPQPMFQSDRRSMPRTSTSFRSTFHIGSVFCVFPASFMSSTYTDIPNLVLFTIQVPIEPPRIVFPTTVLLRGVHVNFVQEVPRGLRCSPRISAICVVEDVSIRLDIVTLEFGAI